MTNEQYLEIRTYKLATKDTPKCSVRKCLREKEKGDVPSYLICKICTKWDVEGFIDFQAPFSSVLMDNSQNRGGAFACTFCPYSTKFATTLKRHISTHTGERPYGCMICGKRFIQRNTLQRHIKSHSESFNY